MKKLLIILIIITCSSPSFAQHAGKNNKGRINVFVIGKERSKINSGSIGTFYTGLRARVHALIHYRRLYIITAWSAEEAADKIEDLVERKQKLLGNIWFDSHGHYQNRYSSFRIGSDEFSFKTINDSNYTRDLVRIAKYSDGNTRIAVGSCYAGADYYFPATDSTPASRMNGDSLMIGLGKIFSNATIFASESWVMSKPGVFSNSFAFAGYPLDRKFRDIIYEPVWERIGIWKEYSSADQKMMSIHTVALDRYGQIHVRAKNYNDLNRSKSKIARVKPKLKAGLAKFT